MRRSQHATALPGPPLKERHDWQTVRALAPYLLAWKGRVAFALVFLIGAKVANVAVPMVFKSVIDTLGMPAEKTAMLVPLGLLAAYGALRFSTSLFTELRELLFARVTQHAVRAIALQVFE